MTTLCCCKDNTNNMQTHCNCRHSRTVRPGECALLSAPKLIYPVVAHAQSLRILLLLMTSRRLQRHESCAAMERRCLPIIGMFQSQRQAYRIPSGIMSGSTSVPPATLQLFVIDEPPTESSGNSALVLSMRSPWGVHVLAGHFSTARPSSQD